MEGLIGFVNRIQTACTAVGDLGSLSSPRDALPSVAVVGGQSSGKSSVLEGIVGKDFLPRGSGMVTRRPLVLQLCKIDAYQQEYAEFSHLPGRKFTDFGMVRKEIWDETNRIPGKTKPISFVPIRLTIHSPHVVNLILIDLPGLTKVAVEGQSESIVQDTESMVRSYIEKPNSIILAIIPANQDIGTSDAIKIAREVDPTGERTLGVLTKLDLTDKVTNALDVLEGRSYRLQHPWVGNRSQADINKNVDMVVARRREQEYFATSPYSHLAPRMGSKNLAKLISRVVELKSGLQNPWEKKEKEEMIENLKLAGGVVGGIAAVALAGWGLSKMGLSDDGGESSKREEEKKKKMMKAPGRDIYIPRDEFEDNPGDYFRNLRQKREEEEKKKMMKAPGKDIYIPRDEFEDNPSAYFHNLRQKTEEEEKKKMMKAPGRDIYIPRDEFEDNPSAYFSNLRQKREEEEKKKMMKAPGRDIYIPRDEFEDNPSAYFSNLRQKTEEEKKKMMKAPGRDIYIPRDEFEDNPSAYFSNLRQKREEEEEKKMMKAPGRGIYIPRDGFEDNPRAYFRNLRQKD